MANHQRTEQFMTECPAERCKKPLFYDVTVGYHTRGRKFRSQVEVIPEITPEMLNPIYLKHFRSGECRDPESLKQKLADYGLIKS